MRWRTHVVACAVVVSRLAVAGALSAQGRFGDEETRLLREAAALESDGDLDGAEASLRNLMRIDPTSTGGIYALERVLRAKGDLVSLLGPVDDFLRRLEDAGMRSLKLQVLVAADSVRAMEREAGDWLAREPRSETAYAEVARAYEAAFGPERALEVLTAGRDRLGANTLALAMGDQRAAMGDIDAAVMEWAKAIQPDGRNLLAVRGRVQALGEERIDAGRDLVRTVALVGGPGRRRTATRLALELALGPEALALAQEEVSRLDGAERLAYLEEVSVAATAAGIGEVASWAYGELGQSEEDPAARRLLDQRRAEAALLAGDTVGALDAFARVASSMPAESTDRRMVEARAIRVAASASEIDRLRALWESFLARYSGAPELDALGAVAASALVAWGDVDGAVSVLDAVEGPRSDLERAYLLLASGELQAGQTTLMRAVGGLPPSEATELIQLGTLLGRVSGEGGQALANASVQAHLGRGGVAAQTLADQAFDLPEQDRPMLLAEAGRMADRAGDDAGAAAIRERLVREYSEAPEAGQATLALARYRAGVEGEVGEAIRLLEDLIVGQPNAAVVPEARLELERLRSRGS